MRKVISDKSEKVSKNLIMVYFVHLARILLIVTTEVTRMRDAVIQEKLYDKISTYLDYVKNTLQNKAGGCFAEHSYRNDVRKSLIGSRKVNTIFNIFS